MSSRWPGESICLRLTYNQSLTKAVTKATRPAEPECQADEDQSYSCRSGDSSCETLLRLLWPRHRGSNDAFSEIRRSVHLRREVV